MTLESRNPYLIKVPLYNMDITGQGLQVVKRLLGTEVPCAEDVLNFPRDEQPLELGWHGVGAMGDVKVP